MENSDSIVNETYNALDESVGEGANAKLQFLLELRKKVADIRQENESLCQELYETKRSTEHLKLMAEETDTQLNSLIQEKMDKKKSEEREVQRRETEILNPLKAKLNSLQLEYYIKEKDYAEKIECLEKKLSEFKRNKDADKITSISKCDGKQVQEENEVYKQKNEEMKETLKAKLEQVKEVEAKISSLTKAINVTQECIESVKSENAALKEDVNELNDDIAVLESDITKKKFQPQVDGTRGNSLFGEVDDRRLIVIEKIKKLEKAYSEMKVKAAESFSTLRRLREVHISILEKSKNNKNDITMTKTENDLNEGTSDETCQANSECTTTYGENKFAGIIKELEAEYELLEAELEEICCTSMNLNEDKDQCMSHALKLMRIKTKDARREVQETSSTCLKLMTTFYSKKMQLLDAKLLLLQEESMVKILSNQLQDYKCPESSNTTPEKDHGDIKGTNVENSTKGSTSKQPEILHSDIKETDVENSTTASIMLPKENCKPEDKKKPTLKFISCQKKFNSDDL